MNVKINRLFCFFTLLSICMAVSVIVFRLQFWVIPTILFTAGFAGAMWNPRRSLFLFLFIFPFINSSSGLFITHYPFNYLAPALFLLSGIVAAGFIRRLIRAPGEEITQENLDREFSYYYIFLAFLVVSTVFILLRWSNIFLPNQSAVGADTPIAPGTWQSPDTQRISFGEIFPVLSLFIYFVSPYIYFYIRKLKPSEKDVFAWTSYGFYVSVAFALAQKISGKSLISDRLGKELKQFYGGFSDFNAFGFFAGVMFLWSTYAIRDKKTIGYVTFAVSLLGGILSGSRTVYFFILAGMFNLVVGALKHRKKQQKIVVGVLVLGVILLLVLAGGTLTRRLAEGFDGDVGFMEKLNAVTNGRVWMTQFTLETIRDNVVPGIGTGNFTFYLAYKNYLPYKQTGEKYLIDLSLNHYLLIFAENGVLAFIFFTLFFVYLFRRSSRKLLMGTMLFALLFNNFFWFPENIILFWLVAAVTYTQESRENGRFLFSKLSKNQKTYLLLAGIAVFILFNILSYNRLHPVSWAQETRIRYDYGFWYPETDSSGREYRWTRDRAGLYINLDEQGMSPEIKMFCGAPLEHLPGKQQKVEIYWRGKLYEEIVFNENKYQSMRIKSRPGSGGFLEIRVTPSFNLKKMNLAPETRTLGLQFYFLEKN